MQHWYIIINIRLSTVIICKGKYLLLMFVAANPSNFFLLKSELTPLFWIYFRALAIFFWCIFYLSLTFYPQLHNRARWLFSAHRTRCHLKNKVVQMNDDGFECPGVWPHHKPGEHYRRKQEPVPEDKLTALEKCGQSWQSKNIFG